MSHEYRQKPSKTLWWTKKVVKKTSKVEVVQFMDFFYNTTYIKWEQMPFQVKIVNFIINKQSW